MTKNRFRLTAFWGNADADSSILVSQRQWDAIQTGAEYTVNGFSYFEGLRYDVVWRFSEGRVSIEGENGMECVVSIPVSELKATSESGS